MKYRILDTETTRDFAEGLIGGTYAGEQQGKYIQLSTSDGELLFDPEEVEEV